MIRRFICFLVYRFHTVSHLAVQCRWHNCDCPSLKVNICKVDTRWFCIVSNIWKSYISWTTKLKYGTLSEVLQAKMWFWLPSREFFCDLMKSRANSCKRLANLKLIWCICVSQFSCYGICWESLKNILLWYPESYLWLVDCKQKDFKRPITVLKLQIPFADFIVFHAERSYCIICNQCAVKSCELINVYFVTDWAYGVLRKILGIFIFLFFGSTMSVQ